MLVEETLLGLMRRASELSLQIVLSDEIPSSEYAIVLDPADDLETIITKFRTGLLYAGAKKETMPSLAELVQSKYYNEL